MDERPSEVIVVRPHGLQPLVDAEAARAQPSELAACGHRMWVIERMRSVRRLALVGIHWVRGCLVMFEIGATGNNGACRFARRVRIDDAERTNLVVGPFGFDRCSGRMIGH